MKRGSEKPRSHKREGALSKERRREEEQKKREEEEKKRTEKQSMEMYQAKF